MKIKANREQEVVIGGFTAPRNSRKHFGAILVGVYDDGRLVYAGHTGGGFDERTLAALAERMKPLIVKQPPFSGKPPETNEKPTSVKPELGAEVKFTEWTHDGVMRQPVFLRLRNDVEPKDGHREEARDADREAVAAAKPKTAGKPKTKGARRSTSRVASKTVAAARRA